MTTRSESPVRMLVVAGAVLVGAALAVPLVKEQAPDGAPDQPTGPRAAPTARGPAAPTGGGAGGYVDPTRRGGRESSTTSGDAATSGARATKGAGATSGARAHSGAGAPRAIVIRSLDIRAPVTAVQADDSVLTPPDDPTRVGWWKDGARPGAARGSAVITGHTVSTGGGAFDDLDRLTPGRRVTVETTTGVHQYTVDRVVTYPKQSLAEQAPRVFDQSVPGRLVLVTCEDWNGEVYLSNEVVVASPLRRSPPP